MVRISGSYGFYNGGHYLEMELISRLFGEQLRRLPIGGKNGKTQKNRS